jgi:hypothetical protein
MQIRNARTLIDGRIDCEIEHPFYGWIPFTADPNDVEAHGRDIFAEAQATAAPYVPPTAEETAAQVAAALEFVRSQMQLSFAQMLIGLVAEAWITESEGEAWLTGTIPAAVTALIDTLPENQRFAARARAARPSVVLRTDSLVLALGAAQGKTAEELDDFFTAYSQL